MITDIVQPLTTEELLKRIEQNQSTLMFPLRNQPIEKLMRDSETNDFGRVLQKYPPIYAEDFTNNVNSRRAFPTQPNMQNLCRAIGGKFCEFQFRHDKG